MEEKGTMHVHLLTELTGNLYSEESEWEEEWSESDEYGMPLDGTELADYEEVIREELERYKRLNNVQHYRKMSNQRMADETREVRQRMSDIIYMSLARWGEEYEQIRQDD